jgi:hypothetical protein
MLVELYLRLCSICVCGSALSVSAALLHLCLRLCSICICGSALYLHKNACHNACDLDWSELQMEGKSRWPRSRVGLTLDSVFVLNQARIGTSFAVASALGSRNH